MGQAYTSVHTPPEHPNPKRSGNGGPGVRERLSGPKSAASQDEPGTSSKARAAWGRLSPIPGTAQPLQHQQGWPSGCFPASPDMVPKRYGGAGRVPGEPVHLMGCSKSHLPEGLLSKQAMAWPEPGNSRLKEDPDRQSSLPPCPDRWQECRDLTQGHVAAVGDCRNLGGGDWELLGYSPREALADAVQLMYEAPGYLSFRLCEKGARQNPERRGWGRDLEADWKSLA